MKELSDALTDLHKALGDLQKSINRFKVGLIVLAGMAGATLIAAVVAVVLSE